MWSKLDLTHVVYLYAWEKFLPNWDPSISKLSTYLNRYIYDPVFSEYCRQFDIKVTRPKKPNGSSGPRSYSSRRDHCFEFESIPAGKFPEPIPCVRFIAEALTDDDFQILFRHSQGLCMKQIAVGVGLSESGVSRRLKKIVSLCKESYENQVVEQVDDC